MTDKKKNRPPKGVAQMPDWWMEVTPHNTLDIEQDETQRKKEYEEAKKYAELAAKADWEQEFGHLELNDDGTLLDKNTGEAVEEGSGGYTRNEKGEWMKDGKQIFGRQFSVEIGSSYDPSKFQTGVHRDQVNLKSVNTDGAEYGHKDNNWKKPDWMKVKLKKTEKHAWLAGEGKEPSPEQEPVEG